MTTALSKLQSSTALSTDVADAIAAAAQEEGTNELGALLKYSKGHYFVGTDEIPMGTEYLAHVHLWVRGYVKFKGGALIEHKVGKVADGFVIPEREDLDETDSSTWEKSPSGEAKDPWTQAVLSPARESRERRDRDFRLRLCRRSPSGIDALLQGRQGTSRPWVCPSSNSELSPTSTRLMAGWTSRFSPSCGGPAMPPANKPRCPRRKKWTTLSLFDGRRTKERRVLLASVASREDLFQ